MRKAALLLLLAAPAAAAPNFIQEPGVRLSSGILAGHNGAGRLYAIYDSTAVHSYTTVDGETLTVGAADEGVRLSTLTVPRVEVSSITGLSLLPLDAGGFRMVYSGVGSTGTLFGIYVASSADGLAWANSTRPVITAAVPLTSPSLVELDSGDWRLYFSSQGAVLTMLSTNEGQTWSGLAIPMLDTAQSVSAVVRTDDRVRLYYSSGAVIASALSTDANGTAFTTETGIRFSTPTGSGVVTNPFILRATSETWRWRMYYNFGPVTLSTPSVYSASIHTPEVTAISPSSLLRVNSVQTFTVTGEIFDPAIPAATLSGPEPVTGLNETRASDVTMTFDANAFLSPGQYNVVVTNPTGQEASLPLGLTIEVPGGNLRTVDNLFRPLQGGRARIDATVFVAGRLTIKLYTADGRFISTLFDGNVTDGTTSVFWDGRDAAGAHVASGVYVVHAAGPKLKEFNKIVVIK